jgi:hypothetical protein
MIDNVRLDRASAIRGKREKKKDRREQEGAGEEGGWRRDEGGGRREDRRREGGSSLLPRPPSPSPPFSILPFSPPFSIVPPHPPTASLLYSPCSLLQPRRGKSGKSFKLSTLGQVLLLQCCDAL